MGAIMDFINWLDGVVWGPPMMVLLVGTGLFLTIALGGIQFRRLGWSIKFTLFEGRKKTGEGDITPFQALMATIAGTVGIGNIAGVATAIHLGGPGALFWMWVTALVGMATRYSEGLLGVAFRDKLPDGTMIGGTFNFLEKGVGGSLGKTMGILFAIFAAISAFGIGNMTQANSLALGMDVAFGVPNWATGALFAFLTFVVIVGGIKRIGEVTEALVPFMAIIYFIFAVGVWIKFAGQLPSAISLVFRDAFTGSAVAGGAVGTTIRWGVARGLFSNEAGLGTATLAHAAARTDHPSRQAHVAMLGPLIDTLIICSLTGISIVATGAWQTDKTSTALTQEAFARAFGHAGEVMVIIGVIFFAYSTVLAWSFYGRQNVLYLAKWIEKDPEKFAKLYPKLHLLYNLLFVIFIYIGATTVLENVWTFSDMMNGLMAIPNLLGLLILYKVVKEYTNEFIAANP
ncbi:alanine glycine permease [Palaeococcus pacificus DY20341]|uniref:Alanine glycine permease n=1 Tax=Palaeococcus pacificus DY20341 TaxID=1343739 RepID=A0A075LVC3_9EURY|nr:sodium:alanine symporter family protein [Palaeococcus pacificus]AIF70289.1 alanine glycine permease [Palaeococcus pacificus DY20341]